MQLTSAYKRVVNSVLNDQMRNRKARLTLVNDCLNAGFNNNSLTTGFEIGPKCSITPVATKQTG